MVNEELLSAMRLVTENSQYRNIFHAILKEGGKASGWAVTKILEEQPETIRAGLDALKAHRILSSTGSGLDGYYYLTPLGFQLRSSMLASG